MPIIKKPFEYFDVITYTGDGTSSRNITGLNFQPDLVWIKIRSSATSHALTDSVREAPNQLSSNSTGAEVSDYYYGGVSGFLSNGFTVVAGGGGSPRVNESGQTYVAWCWKANGTGVTNTAGSITSTVSANTSAGFSVVTWTGNGSAGATVGHGLGVALKMLIVKNRVQGTYGNWNVWHTALTGSQYLTLNDTAGAGTNNNRWNGTIPTSTVFSLGADSFGNTNKSGDTYVAYCFSEVAGYSKFGSYTGNGSTDGTMIATGFRPAFIMIKRTDTTGNWTMYDATRNTYNAGSYPLYPNLSNAEDASTDHFDWLSNGFKMRSTNQNASGGSYIYMAFAKVPQKFSLGV